VKSLLLIFLLWAGAAAAADDPGAITVTALRNPVDKSYRKMVSGMDLFEREHALAPKASLRFKLLPRLASTDMEDIDVRIVADSFETPVDVAPDHTFALPRNRKALAEDASVRPNRKARSMTWRTDIRTPGLPPGTRRLGDLRLECKVGMQAELVSDIRPIIGAIAWLLQKSQGFCDDRDAPYLFFAERPLFGVTLVDGARRQTLPVGALYAGATDGRMPKADLAHCDCQVLLERSYMLPLGDRSWPDDTLVQFEYMDDANHRSTDGATRADVLAALGEGAAVRFDSGYEVRVYRYDEAQPPDKKEFVLLIDPAGRVAKTRVDLL
jgi:hypothetical protein